MTVTLKPGDPAIASGLSRRGVRREIQALRALAIALVLVYHVRPAALPGGFIGVDVFFVISGYLITDHLARGIASSQRFSLADFYSRRIKRLLPASLLTLLAVGIVTYVWVPQTLWSMIGGQLISSAFYAENWSLAAGAVDYLAAGGDSSPVQHFWSLSVEEQFYLVWPIMLVVAALVGAKLGGRRRAMIYVIAGVTTLSFATSVIATMSSPASAYFITPTRAWEFGIGGLCALVLPTLKAPAGVRAAVSWLGLALIAAAAFSLTGKTPFPGYIALVPVVGTVLVMIAGDVPRRYAPSLIANTKPVQFLGDISYSVYLWHWPMIILVPVIIGGFGYRAPVPLVVAIGVASVVAGWLSARFVEAPFRRREFKRRQVFIGALAGMLLVSSIGGYLFAVGQARTTSAQAEIAQLTDSDWSCLGANATEAGCAMPVSVIPNPVVAREDALRQDCQPGLDSSDFVVCEFGAATPGSVTAVLVGDSHANQWLPAVLELADTNGWHVTTYFKSGCPLSANATIRPACANWNTQVLDALNVNTPDLIFTSSSAITDWKYGSSSRVESGFRKSYELLAGLGAEVFVIADTPRPGSAGVIDPPSCIDANGDCNFARDLAVLDDPAVHAALALPSVRVLDLTDVFCGPDVCESVIGGALVYRDDDHMTATFSRTLAPRLQDAIG